MCEVVMEDFAVDFNGADWSIEFNDGSVEYGFETAAIAISYGWEKVQTQELGIS